KLPCKPASCLLWIMRSLVSLMAMRQNWAAQQLSYVRNNPVRHGLVTDADDWAYQGEINQLQWHDR
ncbi:MAG: hypothetical protein AAF585_22295, partial [Verrucomicrobiota bacterium]